MPNYNGSNSFSTLGGAGPDAPAPVNNSSGPSNLGASGSDGEYGSVIIDTEIPGDLGTLYITQNKHLLLSEAFRESALFNGFSNINCRFRGHRESNKLNLIAQKMMTICGSIYLMLKSSNETLEIRELEDMYPTNTEIQNIYHISEQIMFKEYLLLKDDDNRWFN